MEFYQIVSFCFFLIISLLEIEPCDAYSRTYSSWYASWYIWVILFGLAACCCGAAGSYYRRRMIMRANNGQRPGYPQGGPVVYPTGPLPPTGTYPTTGNYPTTGTYPTMGVPPMVTPGQPGIYVPPPQAPPAYNSANTIAAYQPGGDTGTMKKEYAPPPSYSEVCETSSKIQNKPDSS